MGGGPKVDFWALRGNVWIKGGATGKGGHSRPTLVECFGGDSAKCVELAALFVAGSAG